MLALPGVDSRTQRQAPVSCFCFPFVCGAPGSVVVATPPSAKKLDVVAPNTDTYTLGELDVAVAPILISTSDKFPNVVEAHAEMHDNLVLVMGDVDKCSTLDGTLAAGASDAEESDNTPGEIEKTGGIVTRVQLPVNLPVIKEERGSQWLSSPESPVNNAYRKLARKPGRALAERLKNVSIRTGSERNYSLKLIEVRGGTGCVHEGVLLDQSEHAVSCCALPKTSKFHFVIKGPWMLKFEDGNEEALAIGVPIPLDGSIVTPVGEKGFEISNVHVKEDFYGKKAIQQIQKRAKKSFEHPILRQFEALCEASRDKWVKKLRLQCETLNDALARKLQSRSTGKMMQKQMTIGTVAAVNMVAAALFAEYEEDIEAEEFGTKQVEHFMNMK